MSFLNEYISKKNKEKYMIEEEFIKKNPQFSSVPEYVDFQWTFDRERDVYLQLVECINSAYSNDYGLYFKLNCRGDVFVYKLCHGKGGSIDFSCNPYVIVWDLLDVKYDTTFDFSLDEATDLLKEALSVYGYRGIRKQIDNTIVKFNF